MTRGPQIKKESSEFTIILTMKFYFATALSPFIAAMGQSPDQEKKQDQIMMGNELAVQNTAHDVATNNSARLDLANCGKACSAGMTVLLLIRPHRHIFRYRNWS